MIMDASKYRSANPTSRRTVWAMRRSDARTDGALGTVWMDAEPEGVHAVDLDKDAFRALGADLLEIGGMSELANSVRAVLVDEIAGRAADPAVGEYYLFSEFTYPAEEGGQPVRIVNLPSGPGREYTVAFPDGRVRGSVWRRQLSKRPVQVERTETWSVV